MFYMTAPRASAATACNNPSYFDRYTLEPRSQTESWLYMLRPIEKYSLPSNFAAEPDESRARIVGHALKNGNQLGDVVRGELHLSRLETFMRSSGSQYRYSLVSAEGAEFEQVATNQGTTVFVCGEKFGSMSTQKSARSGRIQMKSFDGRTYGTAFEFAENYFTGPKSDRPSMVLPISNQSGAIVAKINVAIEKRTRPNTAGEKTKFFVRSLLVEKVDEKFDSRIGMAFLIELLNSAIEQNYTF